MQEDNNIKKQQERKTLKDFIRLVLAFFCCLFVLSIYQYIRLYVSGVLDSFVNKSLFLLIVHHTGFTAAISLFFAFLFNFLEARKPTLGFKVVRVLLVLLLIVEVLLIEYYVQQYEILGVGILGIYQYDSETVFNTTMAAALGVGVLFYVFYKITASTYNYISKMYPLTLILFSVFLTTLTSDKKPINENKTQYLILSVADDIFDFNKYDGRVEYPLLGSDKMKTTLIDDFALTDQKPNLIFVIIDGLGADFVGKDATYKGIAPFLDTLALQSLYWSNYVSNTGESFAALPTIMGSLPFGKNGFTNIETLPNRHTLFSILKNNGYTTTFNYGGNSALNYLDKFLHEEKVDYILDKKSFGEDYTLQDEDAAGLSLGYPDHALFGKWNKNLGSVANPRLDVFMTLSTKKPFLIPESDIYLKKVEVLLSKNTMDARARKLVEKNKDIFASIRYADDALKTFLATYRKHPDFNNTIFVITGSHNTNNLPQASRLDRYRVPFMIYSPLLKSPKEEKTLTSHADVTPTILSLLKGQYSLKTPERTAWLGNAFMDNHTVFETTKQIPLFRAKNNIRDYIYGPYFMSKGRVYRMDEKLNLNRNRESEVKKNIKQRFKLFKSINTYVAVNNKIVPDSLNNTPSTKDDFTKQEKIWVNSVFNGKDYDNAYNTAKEMAFDDDRERALLLCRHILSQVPGHSDTEILMGRIYAWNGDYDRSVAILQEVIRKYPIYEDGYAALLDVYFWSDRNEKVLDLYTDIERNKIKTKRIAVKMTRAYEHIKKEAMGSDSVPFTTNAQIERYIASVNL